MKIPKLRQLVPKLFLRQWQLNSRMVSVLSTDIVASNGECSSVLWYITMFLECFMMFHNVLSVSWCFTTFHDVSQCLTRVSWCFTIFNNVSQYLVSHATIGLTKYSDSQSANHLRDRDNAAGIGNNSAEIGDDAAGIVYITVKVISC